MVDIGHFIYDVFGPYGWWGILLCVMIVFIVDALIFPTLPELFTVIAFMYDPSLQWGLAIMVTLLAGEFIGMTSLYLVVERVKVPKRVQTLATRYVNFLIVGDERLLLVNRVAPMIPFAGAFVSMIDTWTYKRAFFYLLGGAFAKYGLILAMSGFFFALFSSGEAQNYTLAFVALVIALSFAESYRRKRGMGGGEASA